LLEKLTKEIEIPSYYGSFGPKSNLDCVAKTTGIGHSDMIEYSDDDDNDGIIKQASAMTNERRKLLAEEEKTKGCRHYNGFSIEDSGPVCKDCGVQIKL
jgi:hypothetical protein